MQSGSPFSLHGQAEVIDFLSKPATFGEGIVTVERHETHGAIVFLAGDLAYKLKRAVRYPYMDYSTPALRKSMCEAELAVNRRVAPELYLGVKSIVRDQTGLRFGDRTETESAIDWVVVMRRFAQTALLGGMCDRGEVNENIMRSVAQTVAAFHGDAQHCPDFGGADGILRVINENTTVLNSLAGRPFDPAVLNRFDQLVRQSHRALTPLLDVRRHDGFVRRCHGDLHLDNICVLDGRPVLLDAIEFNEDFSCIDVLYDLALLLMDLDRRGRRALANISLNRYLEITCDYAGVDVLPLFLACRAAIRAHVSATAASLTSNRNRDLLAEAMALLEKAVEYLRPAGPPMLVVTAGYSGTGKSTLARALAPEIGRSPGAIILRSDVIRKRLCGVEETAKLPQAGYSAEKTQLVYRTIAKQAHLLLAAGHSVIADAVYGLEPERETIRDVAQRTGATFVPFWLQAPVDTLETRLGSRTNDVSDATSDTLHRQMEWFTTPNCWNVVDARQASNRVFDKVRKVLSHGRKP